MHENAVFCDFERLRTQMPESERKRERSCVLQNAAPVGGLERTLERGSESRTQSERKNADRERSVLRTRQNATRTQNAVQNAVKAAERRTQCSLASKVMTQAIAF